MKPWYVRRPWQLVRRARAGWRRARAGFRPLPVAWGASVIADPTKTIGRSIWTTGVYDLAVSEVLARVIRPGDTVLDAGANVGYMTLLAGLAVGPGGRVVAWEPHPDLFDVLRRNLELAGHDATRVEARNAALGGDPGRAELIIPHESAWNDGLAFIGEAGDATTSVPVPVETIDDVIGDVDIDVLKLDVEGFELAVLRGARRALDAGRIRHIVFEEHGGAHSRVRDVLDSHGYRTLSIGWSLDGPRLSATETLAASYEAPNSIATLAPSDVVERCSSGGWLTLSGGFRDRLRQ